MYKSYIRPFLEKLDHEVAQHSAREILHFTESNPLALFFTEYLINKGKRFTHPALQTTIGEIILDNPIMLAAGWDKAGRAVRGLYSLGFSAIEVGTITAYPQPGNFKPRLHAIGQGVSLNSYGFPSPGMEIVAKNLERYRNDNIPIGINIGKNKYIPIQGVPYMHAVVARRLYSYATYFTLGISSPNTTGIKTLQKKKYLKENVWEIHAMMEEIGFRKPLFIKVAPEIDESTLDGVLEVIFEEKLAGIIAVNTYTQKNILGKYGVFWEERPGGIGGNDVKYKHIATQKIAQIYAKTQGKIPIIGTGGIYDVQSALEKIAAGANALQLLTGLFFEGPSLPGKINRGLVEFMEKEKIKNLSEIRGIDAKEILENKNGYSFSFQPQSNSLKNLKKEYLRAVFQQDMLDTLLINKNPYQLKHGEFGRETSHIYLNHRIPLFSSREYRKLFGKILHILIQERWGISDFGLISIPSSGSPELINSLMENSNEKLSRFTILSKILTQEEKGTNTLLYGNIDDKKQWFMVDDVFTSGKTMKDVITTLKANRNFPKKIDAVSLIVRNTDKIEKFKEQTGSKIVPFLTLDEVLMSHWKRFSQIQKKLIQKERESLN